MRTIFASVLNAAFEDSHGNPVSGISVTFHHPALWRQRNQSDSTPGTGEQQDRGAIRGGEGTALVTPP